MKIPGLFFYTFFCGIENSSIVFISFNLCLYPINFNMAEQNMPAFNPIPARGGGQFAVCIKCLFFENKMCTFHKVGGEDSKGRKVL